MTQTGSKRSIAGAVYIGAVILFALSFVAAIILSIVNGLVSKTLLTKSTSPDGVYTLEAYQVNPGATSDFSVQVYLESDGRLTRIYNAYHEVDVEIAWIGDGLVAINGHRLDLKKGQTYDFRRGDSLPVGQKIAACAAL